MFDIHGFEMTVFKLLIGVTLTVLHLLPPADMWGEGVIICMNNYSK